MFAAFQSLGVRMSGKLPWLFRTTREADSHSPIPQVRDLMRHGQPTLTFSTAPSFTLVIDRTGHRARRTRVWKLGGLACNFGGECRYCCGLFRRGESTRCSRHVPMHILVPLGCYFACHLGFCHHFMLRGHGLPMSLTMASSFHDLQLRMAYVSARENSKM